MKIINGDSLKELKTLEENSIDAVVTDPPYGLSFMGKKWDYDVPSSELWVEVMRVLKPGGHLLSFAGSRTYHRMAVNIEDAGFEIRDQIMWVYGSGFPKSLNVGKSIENFITTGNASKNGFHKLAGKRRDGRIGMYDTVEAQGFRKKNPDQLGAFDLDAKTPEAKKYEGWGTALKPAHEPIVLARKPLSEKTIAKNVLEWGTGGINIDGCRVEHNEPIKTTNRQKDNGGTWDSSNTGLRDNPGTIASADQKGRFPANFIHDGSDEVVGLFPSTGKGNGGKPYNYAGKEYDNAETSMFNGDKPQAPSNFNDSGSASRFFYCAKASKKDRNEGLDDFEEKAYKMNSTPKRQFIDGVQQSVDFTTKPLTNKNVHPTVKPTALMQYLVRLVTPVGGTVLDPFMGSGSTGKACVLEGFDFIGIELDPEYCKIAQARIEAINQDHE